MPVARSKLKISGWLVVAAAAALTVVTMALAAIGLGPRFTQVAGKGPITIAASDLERGAIKFFSYRDDAGKDIRFILGRDERGRVQAAFDACQQCAQYRKGYTSSRGYLVCRFCGNRYRLDTKAGVGSCAPIKLPVHDNGKTVTVDTSQLEQRRSLF
jgi:uncharacterized membrane protein